MFVARLKNVALILVASVGLAGCAYDDYGYGGVSVGYGSGYYDPWYYPRSYYGWYDGFYYPGSGYYIYDRRGYRHRWSDHHRRYWEGRREWRGDRREARENWRDFRRQARPEDRAFTPGRDRDAFRAERVDRERFRAERRQDRPEFRRGREDSGRAFTAPRVDRETFRAGRGDRQQHRAEPRQGRGEARGNARGPRGGEQNERPD